MSRRMRSRTVRAMLVGACASAVTLGLAATASAYITSDLIDWNLTESTSAYGGGTQFHTTNSPSGTASFRWLDATNKTTVISGNSCVDGSSFGASTYGAGDTSYHGLFGAAYNTCFTMRGRTAAGSGAMYDKDGRSQR